MTSKSQATIPQTIREAAGIVPHTDVEFSLRGKDVVSRKTLRTPAARQRRLIRRLRGRASAGMSTDEIMALTRSL